MADNYSAQNSITVKRLRSGDNLMLTFDNNGIPLFQAVDTDTGAVTPDWTIPVNQPIRTPKVVSTRNNPIVLSGMSWSYNGILLVFNGAESGGWKKDSTGRFAINTSNGSIKIISNLASKQNIAGDTLSFNCVATASAVEYNLSGDINIAIQNMGANSYYLSILASTEQLTSAVANCMVTTKLYASASEVTDYYVKWYKDTVLWGDKTGQKSIMITRDDVSGTQLFIAEVYKSASDINPIARSGVRIIDTADDFQINCYISSSNKEVDTGKPVIVEAKIINMTTGAVYVPSTAIWSMDIMEKETWKSLKHSDTNSISVTTAETDRNGKEYDVDVVAECSFT